MMKYNATIFLLVTLLLGGTYVSYAQGCSDAGFCTMGAMKPGQSYNKKVKLKLRSIEVSYYRGESTLTPVIFVANIDAAISITKNLGMQIKLPYQWVTGAFDDTGGMGDISISATQRVLNKEKFDLNVSIGAKIPTNDSNMKSSGKKQPESKGLPLPMYYQTSLGSYDVIAGASVLSSKWMFATGIQIALTENKNDYWPEGWRPPVWPEWAYTDKYDRATNLHRGIDVMLRVERTFRFSNFSFNIGVLPIYRITKDEVDKTGLSDEGKEVRLGTGEREKLEGTTGLALTLLAGFAYQFNTSNSVALSYGKKLTDRNVNPDGLTRVQVFTVAYGFRF
jgi:hypothetical protein